MRTLKEQLCEWKQKQPKRHQPMKRKRAEKLSTRDIENLMGVHGPRYERRRGAWRQK